MRRFCFSPDDVLLRAECPPHIQQAVLALRDHIATCGPARWRGSRRRFWTLTASVRGHLVCIINWQAADSRVYVVVRDRAPGDGPLVNFTYIGRPDQTFAPVDSVDAAVALVPRLTTAYALASRRSAPSPRTVKFLAW